MNKMSLTIIDMEKRTYVARSRKKRQLAMSIVAGNCLCTRRIEEGEGCSGCRLFFS